MKKKKNILFLLALFFTTLLLSRVLLSCPNPSFDTAFRTFTEELFRKELSANTISLHYTLENPENYDLTSCPITYGTLSSSPDEALSSVEATLSSLEVFDSVPLSEENRLTYNILHDYLELGLEGANYVLYQEPLSSISGVHTQLPILLCEFQFHDAGDVTTYLQLLSQTDAYFSDVMVFEYQKIEHGSFMPDHQVDLVLDYCSTFINMGSDNPLATSFCEKIEKLPITEKEKADYISQNEATLLEHVIPAYEYLITTLQKLKGNGTNEMGLCYYPEGKEYFSYLIKQETGLSKTVEELQEMTCEQISADLFALEQTLSVSNSLSDDSILSATPASMLDDLKSKTTSQFPSIPVVDTEIKYVSSAMEEFLSPAFYMIPAIDDHEENVIYINQGQTLDGLNLYTTLAHEGYPGHLYQTVYFSSQKPDPIRSILHFGGYIEGWATYAEMMSYYLAPLPKSEATLLQKNNSIILGLYALADMGIHYDGWTCEETLEFFSDYGITDSQVIQEIYELIIGSPANYSKYYLGYLTFYNLKKEASDVLGEDFYQLEFHKAVLDVGPAPFDIVEDYVRKRLY